MPGPLDHHPEVHTWQYPEAQQSEFFPGRAIEDLSAHALSIAGTPPVVERVERHDSAEFQDIYPSMVAIKNARRAATDGEEAA